MFRYAWGENIDNNAVELCSPKCCWACTHPWAIAHARRRRRRRREEGKSEKASMQADSSVWGERRGGDDFTKTLIYCTFFTQSPSSLSYMYWIRLEMWQWRERHRFRDMKLSPSSSSYETDFRKHPNSCPPPLLLWAAVLSAGMLCMSSGGKEEFSRAKRRRRRKWKRRVCFAPKGEMGKHGACWEAPRSRMLTLSEGVAAVCVIERVFIKKREKTPFLAVVVWLRGVGGGVITPSISCEKKGF